MILRYLLAGAFIVSAITVGVACSSDTTDTTPGGTASSSGTSGTGTSSGNASSSGSGSGYKDCSGSSSGVTCTNQADVTKYSQCVATACDSQYKQCFGDNFKSGTFGGACGTWITCTQKCGCGDTACAQACGLPDQACQDCEKGFATCAQSCAPAVACQTASSSGSTTSSGGTGKTCADLSKCCPNISDANYKSACTQTVSSANDQACGAAYSTYQAKASSCN